MLLDCAPHFGSPSSNHPDVSVCSGFTSISADPHHHPEEPGRSVFYSFSPSFSHQHLPCTRLGAKGLVEGGLILVQRWKRGPENWTFFVLCFSILGLPGGSVVKSPPARVWSLGWEDPLEKDMETHSSMSLPGKSHGQRSLVGCNPWGRKEPGTTERLTYK